MKKKYIYLLLLLTASVTLIFVFAGGNKIKNVGPAELLPRQSALAYPGEWELVQNNASVLQEKIRNNPNDVKSLMALTALYLLEARITGNFDYYHEAALSNINKVLAQDASDFEALTFKATILLSQHHFEDALHLAGEIQKLYPYSAYVYGLLVDANLELGKYKEALDAAEKMISIRPDIRSYSRIAYLRELHGDLSGAIEAMKMAVDAGLPGDENTEWCRVQLGKLYEKTGQLQNAFKQYSLAAENRHNYPYALAGLARIALAEKNHARALTLFRQADSLYPADHTFKEGLAAAYKMASEPQQARKVSEQILNGLKNTSGKPKKNAARNDDLELAHAYIGTDQLDKALRYAMQEYKRRPAHIEVNETLAMIYYLKAEYPTAKKYIETALQTDCKNPELLCYAGLIYARTGDNQKAATLLRQVLGSGALIDEELKSECLEVMQSLP
jgi:tetratricopeptide (TPR) repeat protein